MNEIAAGGSRSLPRISAAVNAARRVAWAQIEARHGALPGIRVADKVLDGVTCLRLDATVVACHGDQEGAEPNSKGFGLRPLGCWCDNTAEPLAAKLRPGSAGPGTTADHLEVLGAAIAVLPPKYRRLMVTCDGAGASHGLIERLNTLAARPGHQLIYSVGWNRANASAPRPVRSPNRPSLTGGRGRGRCGLGGSSRGLLDAELHRDCTAFLAVKTEVPSALMGCSTPAL